MSGRHTDHYLQAMGIERWQLRGQEQQADEDVATTDQQPQPQITLDNKDSAIEQPTSPAASATPVVAQSDSAIEIKSEDERAARIAQLDWTALQAEVSQCRACSLHTTRTQAVFGVGNQQADWMIIGEAPGADEDRLGEPFVGRAGKLLDLMLQAMRLQREDIYIANILKSRPPNNRDPSAEEMHACWPYLLRQIALIQPKIIMAMGRIAAQSLLNSKAPVGRLRGQLHHFGQFNTPLVVTYHPAYLLRSPREKRKSWADLQFALQTVRTN